ncbi:TetR/AcrR family transcriptional regulator [Sphingobium sp. EM0848]|uniref:TetR/AcrR family transcriptional regulator n=1 Tax=Sphingobium sp. EM0848 TaxID=2743473 RepID=UPI00159C9267|nr:hypothetical protein [Sphingobium sp. EM0848]
MGYRVAEKTKLNLIIAAEELVAIHGLGGVSAREIARRSGKKNNVVVQYHFNSIDQLYDEVVKFRMAQLEAIRAARVIGCDLDDLGIDELVALVCLPHLQIRDSDGRYSYAAFLCHYLSFSQPAAPDQRHTQVFEMMQNMGIYRDGWMAGTAPAAAPWDITKAQKIDLTKRKWELYQVSKDFSQSKDLAAAQPDKLREMQALFYAEAEKAKILPIHGIMDGAQGRPSLAEGRTSFTYHAGLTRVPENTAPHVIGRSFDITADMEIPAGGTTNGVIVTQGGRFGGYALYVKDGKPVFHYNMTNDMQYRIASQTDLTPGRHQLVMRLVLDKPERGSGGVVTLLLDGEAIGNGRVEHTHRAWISNAEGFDVGEDTLTPINDDYKISESRFNARLESVRIDLK